MADQEVGRIALEEVTNAAFNGVLRALEARKIPLSRFPGPIIVGIIAWPELQPSELSKQLNATAGGDEQ
jgi:hypothetical protein